MENYRLATYQATSGPRAALIIGQQLHDLAELAERPGLCSLLAVLEDWQDNEVFVQQLAALSPPGGMPLSDVQLLAPIMYPSAVYCAGANYADHVRAMEERLGLPPGPDPRADGARPFHFLKPSRCCVGDGASVRAPSAALDWEGELVAVIGTEARNVAVDEALKHVAGYMVGNDLSARDIGFRSQLPNTSIFHHSFVDHKGFESAAPVGPWVVPAAFIADPSSLAIRTEVNGELRQNGATSGMIFSLQEQIAYLSSVTRLFPGDLIMTGTPAGTGAESGEFLSPGDEVTVTIDRIGKLTTYIM